MLAQAEEEKKEENKPTYHLFKPSPRDKMRELSTDRPDKTESPVSVDPGHFQVEMDFATMTYDRFKPKGEKTTDIGLGIGIINAKAGLTENSDFQLMIESLNMIWNENKDTKTLNQSIGFGDITLRYKYSFLGNDGGSLGVGIMPFVKIPTAKKDIGNGAVEGGLIFLVSKELPRGVSMGTMLEIDINKNEGPGYHPEIVTSITFSRELIGKLSGYLELWNNLGLSGNGVDWKMTLDAGLTYLATPNIQLDLGVNVGLTPAADDVAPFTGISFKY